MKVICAWCGKSMGEKEGEGVEGVSHGICEECLEKLKAEKESRVKEEDGQHEANLDGSQ